MSRRIMYCALPTRMREFSERAKEITRSEGYSPVVPFDALSYEDSEAGPLSRERTLRFDVDLMRCCDTLGIFGIAPGVMGELQDALVRGMEVRVFHGHDPKWETEYELLKQKRGDLLAELRGPHRLIALVGQTAIGKTFWSRKLRDHFGSRLKLVKSTTTRQPRNEDDREFYNFVSREEFERYIGERYFLEYDEYLGSYYGSSMLSIKSVLNHTNGIFAVTPSGARVLYKRRFEINLSIILLKPENEAVIRRNLEFRDITDPEEQNKLIQTGSKFTLEPEIEHNVIEMSGDQLYDRNNLLQVVEPLLAPRN